MNILYLGFFSIFLNICFSKGLFSFRIRQLKIFSVGKPSTKLFRIDSANSLSMVSSSSSVARVTLNCLDIKVVALSSNTVVRCDIFEIFLNCCFNSLENCNISIRLKINSRSPCSKRYSSMTSLFASR